MKMYHHGFDEQDWQGADYYRDGRADRLAETGQLAVAPGPWQPMMADDGTLAIDSAFWCVFNRATGTLYEVGPVGDPVTNYYVVACKEAQRRNKEEVQS